MLKAREESDLSEELELGDVVYVCSATVVADVEKRAAIGCEDHLDEPSAMVPRCINDRELVLRQRVSLSSRPSRSLI